MDLALNNLPTKYYKTKPNQTRPKLTQEFFEDERYIGETIMEL